MTGIGRAHRRARYLPTRQRDRDNGGAHIRYTHPQYDYQNHERERTTESALAGIPPTVPKRQYISSCPRSWLQRYK